MKRSLDTLHGTILGGLALLGALVATPALAGKVTVSDDGGADAAFASKRVAVLIGVDTYADPELSTLEFAGKDARDMASTLRDESIGDYDEVHVLTGADATSRAAILAKLREVTAGLQRDDTFLLYLSGHGTLTLDPIDGTRLWFLPSDSDLSHPEDRGIDVAWLEETVTSLVPRRRVLIMDTCHNGRADGARAALNNSTRDRLSILRGEPPAPNPVAEVTDSEARLYAAQYYQPAMEDKSLQNGVYTHYLIAALSSDRGESDLDGNGLVDVTEAHAFAMDATIRHTGGLQVPRSQYNASGKDSIYLAGNPSQRTRAERALISSYDGLLANARLFIDGQARGSLPMVHAIEPGKHRVEIQTTDGRTIYADTLQMQAGNHYQVEDLRPVRTEGTLFVGGLASHGYSAMPTLTPEVELGIRPAMKGNWKLGVHARLSPSFTARDYQTSFDPESRANVWSGLGGLGTVGAFLGYRASNRLLIGPELEAGGYYRRITCNTVDATGTIDGTCVPNGADGRGLNEFTATILPGLRAELRPADRLSIRYDVRLVPLPTEGNIETALTHGLSVGTTF